MTDKPVTATAAPTKPDPVLHVGALVFIACCLICHELVIGDPPPVGCPGCGLTGTQWLRGTAEVTDVR